MNQTHYWNNKKVFITGGTSGLGRALALQLVEQGASVAVLARNLDRLRELQRQDSRIHVIQGDITDKESIHRIHAEALAKLGDVDVLFNNASSLGPTPLRFLIDTECEDFSLALETNLLAPFRLTKLALASMILRNSGVVVNISSDAAIQDYSKWGAYSVSKSALDHLTRIFQAELSDTKVRFLAVDPGDMATPLHLTAIPEADVNSLHQPADSARRLISLIASEDFSAAHRGLR